jgi:hypothetical protein
MKSLITRFARIGSIFSLVLAASSAAALPPPPVPMSVRVHEVATISYNGTVLVEVTAQCSGPPGSTLPVSVELAQLAGQSHAGTAAAGTGVSSVACDTNRQTVALTVPATTGPFNLGDATADSVRLGAGNPNETTNEIMKPIQIVFAVGENHEQEEGGNPEE